MFENYDKNSKYLLACSGGPDSMALLNMLVKSNFNIIVAHVNYKTRKESDLEEQLVIKYCNEHNLKYFITYFDNIYKGSFEAAARKFRYSFFQKVYEKEKCSGLFVAHHKDDVIETYLLKKQRNVVNNSYLINQHTIINKMNVYRPLIFDFYKEDLLDYCHKNNILYGIDKTNFMDIYPRNKIRMKIANMDKQHIYNQALLEEEILIETRKKVKEYIKYYPIYLSKYLKEQNDLFLSIFLYEICEPKYKRYINKSKVLALKDFINSDKPNLYILIKKDYYLEKNYNQIALNHRKLEKFNYVLEKLEFISTPYFSLTDNGLKMHGVFVSKTDFPITIRNYNNDDKIMLKEGSKKISRLFIDKKVPVLERYMVPVIENCNKEIIFVYNLYRKYGLKYVKNNLFMVK